MEFRARTTNRIVVLKKASEVLENWQFILEGLTALNETSKGKMFMPPEIFFRIIMDTLARGETYGIFALMQSKNGKNVGFFLVKDDTEKFFIPTACVWAAYSTNNNTEITKDMIVLGEEWARAQGYKQYYAICLRTGASIKRLYTKKWRFSLQGLIFKKELS